jgi:hypothetical protein
VYASLDVDIDEHFPEPGIKALELKSILKKAIIFFKGQTSTPRDFRSSMDRWNYLAKCPSN